MAPLRSHKPAADALPMTSMAAARLHARGGPEQIVYERVAHPPLRPGDALVRVFAAAITPTELSWESTYTTHDGTDRLPSIPSHGVSGEVVQLEAELSGISVGDDVYGLTDFWRDGAAAEYVAVRAADLALRPTSLDHAHAAAMPLSALTAWQALCIRGWLSARQRVLIHGGAGGVGTFAVQIAHMLGAHVLATAASRDTGFVQQLGADIVIDYTTTRFEDVSGEVDLVLDTVGGETLRRSWTVVKPGGVVISTVKKPSPAHAAQRGARGMFFVVEPNRGQLIDLAGLADAGRLRPVIASVFPLARARDAYTVGLAGHVRGKIVVAVAG
jgi:NADPH:quinone reductase-like Zn-dependent oxidoreductase